MPTKILLVEDDVALIRSLKRFLERTGFTVSVAVNGKEGLAKIRQEKPDLIVLDDDMPQMKGSEMLQDLRQEEKNSIPIIMMTKVEHNTLERAELFLDGIKGYLTKPFDTSELEARINSVLQLTNQSLLLHNAPSKLRCRHLSFELSSRRLIDERSGKEIRLPRQVKSLLEYMMLNRGVLLTHDVLYEFLHPISVSTVDKNEKDVVRSAIKRLRSKLAEAGLPPQIIETRHEEGFIFSKEEELE